MDSTDAVVCAGCGAGVPTSLLSCPSCRRLVHGESLKQLSGEAETMTHAGRLTAALTVWRRVLELLPPDTRQHQAIVARIAALRERVDAAGYSEPEPADSTSAAGKLATGDPSVEAGPREASSRFGRQAALLGIAGLALWKFKFVFVFVATKLKFLVMGLSKSTTLLSMLVYLGPCWARWGWEFGIGIVLSIYIHEMGHVAALTRYGISASAPMFIPGLGALVRLNQYPSDATEDARIGLAGPLWGCAAALAAYGASLATGHALLAAVAKFGAWINLFNLVPFWQLDGGRGFRALPRRSRVVAVLGAAAVLALTHEGLLALIVLAGTLRIFASDCPPAGGNRALAEFLFLIASLSVLNAIPIPPG